MYVEVVMFFDILEDWSSVKDILCVPTVLSPLLT